MCPYLHNLGDASDFVVSGGGLLCSRTRDVISGRVFGYVFIITVVVLTGERGVTAVDQVVAEQQTVVRINSFSVKQWLIFEFGGNFCSLV